MTDKTNRVDMDLDPMVDFREEDEEVVEVARTEPPLEFLKDGHEMYKKGNSKVKTSSIERNVLNQYISGAPVTMIIRENEISSGTLYSILQKHKIPNRSRPSKVASTERLAEMSNITRNSLIIDYQQSVPLSKLFEKYDINKHGVYSILDAENIPRRNNDLSLPSNQEKEVNLEALKKAILEEPPKLTIPLPYPVEPLTDQPEPIEATIVVPKGSMKRGAFTLVINLREVE